MALKVIDATAEVDGKDYPYEKLGVDGEVSLQDFIEQANLDGIPMSFAKVQRGRVKDGETREAAGFLNYLLDAFNLARYRDCVASNKAKETPQEKAIKSLVKLLGISEEEATKRVNG